jgi:hypothetical protein
MIPFVSSSTVVNDLVDLVTAIRTHTVRRLLQEGKKRQVCVGTIFGLVLEMPDNRPHVRYV